MNRLRFVLWLAGREARVGLKRAGIYTASIALGVGALVSIHSFREDVSRSLHRQARVLMGADLRMRANRPLPDSVLTVVDSLVGEGAVRSDITTAVSMVRAPRTERVRLLQVRGVDGAWPLYGRPTTRPAARWGAHLSGDGALVDPAVLTQLDVGVGDTLAVGTARVRIEGTADDLPTDVGFQTAVGPRVWISGEVLRSAGLLGFGSLARYDTYLALPDDAEPERVEGRYRTGIFRPAQVSVTTAEEQARDLVRALGYLSRYLGLVGLAALLLGGIGVAAAVHVYVKERLSGIAVLRCIGARQWHLFLVYLLQAAGLGLLGAVTGVVAGVSVQRFLPLLLVDVLPVEVQTRMSTGVLLSGMAVGVAVAVLFALGPLLAVRDVPPLRALRADFESEGRRRWWPDPWRASAHVTLGLGVVGLCVYEAPTTEDGLAFAGALALTAAALWATGRILVHLTRRFFPARASYIVRQGVANLFRPRNQTISVTLALGFGAFVVGTVLQVEASLAAHLTLDEGTRPNLLLFDIQPDQVAGVLDLLPVKAAAEASVTPVVPSRLARIRGRTPAELWADTSETGPRRWAARREYRHTYRDVVTDAEAVVAGRWFEEGAAGRGTEARPARVSMETDIADDLGVTIGDRITWDVSGRRVVSVVTSLRRVEWDRFSTNFFVVFEPGVLEEAPQMSVLLSRVEDAELRSTVQRDLVETFPNVSVLDLQRVQDVVDTILGRVRGAVGFLAGFCAAAGLLVLAGALAASRHQRIQESALLRTLGARREQVVSILLSEYLALGSVAALTGLLLALLAASAMVRGMLGIPFVPAPGALVLVWAGVTALTVIVGLIGSRGVLTRPPLPVLRAVTE